MADRLAGSGLEDTRRVPPAAIPAAGIRYGRPIAGRPDAAPPAPQAQAQAPGSRAPQPSSLPAAGVSSRTPGRGQDAVAVLGLSAPPADWDAFKQQSAEQVYHRWGGTPVGLAAGPARPPCNLAGVQDGRRAAGQDPPEQAGAAPGTGDRQAVRPTQRGEALSSARSASPARPPTTTKHAH